MSKNFLRAIVIILLFNFKVWSSKNDNNELDDYFQKKCYNKNPDRRKQKNPRRSFPNLKKRSEFFTDSHKPIAAIQKQTPVSDDPFPKKPKKLSKKNYQSLTLKEKLEHLENLKEIDRRIFYKIEGLDIVLHTSLGKDFDISLVHYFHKTMNNLLLRYQNLSFSKRLPFIEKYIERLTQLSEGLEKIIY